MTSDVTHEEVLTVQAMDGQYLLEASGQREDPWPMPWLALFTGEDTWIAFLTGTQYGPISVRLQIRETMPKSLDSGWDMIGERDLWCNSGGLHLHDLYTNSPAHHVDVAAGPYRVRIHVANRARAAAMGDVKEAVEHHLLQIWPISEDAEPQLLKGPDVYASNHH